MPLESGGRADKFGNKYETEFIISQLLNLYEEEITGLIYEPLGDDELGIDVIIYHKNNIKELAQCKIRNNSKNHWTMGDLKSKNILKNWKNHLNNDEANIVTLVSPLPATGLQDMITRALNSKDSETFYNNQIMTSGYKFRQEFETFCRAMNLSVKNIGDLSKAINYLKRINLRQFADNSTIDLKFRIQRLFVGNRDDIYSQFFSAVINEDIYGKFINITNFKNFLNRKEIHSQNLAHDTRINPQIERLNREFEVSKSLINSNLIEREAFKQIHQSIKNNKSVIVHGSAGNGKTVAILSAIDYCKKNGIPYLAIKLDKNPPEKSHVIWSEELGLPDSLSLCLDSISKNSPAVLILDQLDSLRWTQSHSSKSLEVCKEIINEIKSINQSRKKPISVIFACRSYDLNNDSQIKQLFIDENSEWSKIEINRLSDEELKLIIGKAYPSLTFKTKELLKTPSNLFIWNQLSDSENYSTEYSSTYGLVNAWWANIEKNWKEHEKNEREIIVIRDKMVRLIDSIGRQYIPKNLLKEYGLEKLEYLTSQNFINIDQNKVSFIHQSIFDSFIVDNMIEKYYENQSILNILGSFEKQTPSSKYQVQLFLEYLLTFNTNDFLDVGQKIYESNEIRFFIKYTFLEILSELKGNQINKEISNFIVSKINDLDYQKYLIQDVIYGKSEYISLLIRKDIIGKWLKDESLKFKVLYLFASIYPDYPEDVISYLDEIISHDEELASEFSRYFSWNYEQDTDEFFELRLKCAKKHPEQVTRQFFDFEKAFDEEEVRTIRFIRLLYENQDENVKVNIENSNIKEIQNKDIRNYRSVLQYLLPTIPKNISKFDMNWNVCGFQSISIERIIISLIKKANIALIKSSQKEFIEIYKQQFDARNKNIIFNEILLDAFYYMDTDYSEKIIEYLFKNIEHNLFDESSEEQNKLTLGKKIISKHSKYVSGNLFLKIERAIVNYKPTDMVNNYKEAVNFRKFTNKSMFRSFWGDFQFELLNTLPVYKLSDKSKNLLSVLDRKFPNGTSKYMKLYPIQGGFVSTKISDMDLGIKQWKNILTDEYLEEKLKSGKSEWGTDWVIENSLYGFSNDFKAAVSKKPCDFIELYLGLMRSKRYINISFERAFYSGLEQSEKLIQISTNQIEELINDKTVNDDEEILKNICGIIIKLSERKWSLGITNLILKLAREHENPQEYDEKMITSFQENEDLTHENLINNYYNSVRGIATQALVAIYRNEDYSINEYKKIVEIKIVSDNLVDQFGALNLLVSMFNDNQEWATKHSVTLYKKNIILFGHHHSKDLMHMIYRSNEENIQNIIIQAYNSSYQRSVKNAGYALTEFYIMYGKFKNYFSKELLSRSSEMQRDAIHKMLVLYLESNQYKDMAKELLIQLIDLNLFNTNFTFNIFNNGNLDAETDAELMLKIIGYDRSGRTYYNFYRFLHENNVSFIDYAHIIIESSKKLIQNAIENNEYDIWGISTYLPTLVIHLYDEVVNDSQQTIIMQVFMAI